MADPTMTRHTAPMTVRGPQGARFGDYVGLTPVLRPPGITGAPGRRHVEQFLRHKRWMYTFAATPEILVTAAIVDAGPTGTAFLTVADRRTGHLLADVSRPGGTGPLVSVNDRPGEGHRSRYRTPGTAVAMHARDGVLSVRAKIGSPIGLPAVGRPSVHLRLDFDTSASPALTVISDLDTEPPLVSTTGKSACLPVSGSVSVQREGSRHEFDMEGALGGFDYTSGLLPRRTRWRWAYLTGELADGRTVGVNVSAGFSGLHGRARENSLWLDGRLHALDPDAAISYRPDDPGQPWHVTTADGLVDLTFHPVGVHRESLNLGVFRSRFLQPVGSFTGTIETDGETVVIDGLPGVVENQDVIW